MIQKLDKGTESAHEIINENFEKIGFELVENENGSCIRYENGYQLCEKKSIPLVWKNSMQMTAIWEYPLPFIERPTVVATKNNSSNPTVRRSSIGVEREMGNCEILLDAQVGESIAESQQSSAHGFAYGKWK